MSRMSRMSPLLITLLVATAIAVPPNPQSWDLDDGTHLVTGEPVPWGALEALALTRDDAPPLPAPPLMGAVAVLVEFPDHQADDSHPQSAYRELLFSQGTYPTGSLRDYWNTVSYDVFDLSGGVAGWFMTAENYDDYYNDGNYGLSYGGYRVAQAAAELADPTVDFGDYDNDGPDGIPNSGDDDGYVDLFMVYHAGPDGADSGDPNDIWSHMSWSISYTTDDPAFGGGYIEIDKYDIQAEERTDGSLSGISVACHEMGHLLDLPDQYGSARYDLGTGLWSLMSYGAWGADGLDDRYPSLLDAWSRSELGWTNVINIDTDENDLVVHPAETDSTVYTLWQGGVPETNEWFYLENRQQLDPEPTLVGEGLLVYHIYSGAHGFSFNYDDLDVEQADGLDDLNNGDGERPDPEEDNIGDDGDPFPGSTDNTRFGDDTNPSSSDQGGYPTWVEISDIHLSGDNVICDITIDTSAADDLYLSAQSRDEGLLLRWSATTGCRLYRLSRWENGDWSDLSGELTTSAYLDRDAEADERYRLQAFDDAGRLTASLESDFVYRPPSPVDNRLALYPNPSRGPLSIELELAVDDDLELAVYDLAGRRLAVVASGHYAAGRHTMSWNSGLAAGVYVLRLEIDGQVTSRRVVIDR